ncbi:uncharacterized protein LOC127263706 [Andrographis paniculata]|uniref:uncharacterized protein LOC127263706 n=1 Tax=Andrographis paniculata TaxID=175694 RepID=UPI0021E8C972|nr:uncharacterized protein LOC127263706 [Andrographis paniculata]XP_051148833.1 uncharacterized protein LOC127263706 [Andrographis paniculata]XP_051148834.1 uncharacterized protein LOC127263706 [Andrographis paniculata]
MITQPNINPAIQFAALTIRHGFLFPPAAAVRRAAKLRAFSTNKDQIERIPDKPPVCTADELHYVTIDNSEWRLALWRYNPSPQAPPRNLPLLLLSGVGTNAIGYDLAHGSSFARYMCGQGFDTWILEVRGAGLSAKGSDCEDVEKSAHAISDQMEAAAEYVAEGAIHSNQNGANGKTETAVINEESDGDETTWDKSRLATELTEVFSRLSERLSGFLSESQSNDMFARFLDQISKQLENSFIIERYSELRERLLSLLKTRQDSAVASQIRDLSQKLVDIIDEAQRSVSPQIFDLQERLMTTVEDFQKQLDLIVKYDWDFDNYLEEDVPAAMEYILAQCKPKDGRLFAIGHSMGGILLYARLSRFGFEGRDPGLAAIVTLASSFDYTTSESSLKLLLPLADPAQALNVPVVPLGAFLSAAYPLSSRPPYVLSWLNDLISSEDMMHPELLKKLVLNNFCTIPARLILQLTTAFREGGLRDRSCKFFYKDHIHKSNIPVLALAGDRDLICPPEAVYETVKLIPEHLVTYKVLGEPDGPHYAHYDLVGGRMAVEQVYPCIIEFLSRHDLPQ